MFDNDKARITDKIIRDYKRKQLHPPSQDVHGDVHHGDEIVEIGEGVRDINGNDDLDQLASDMCNELILQLTSKSKYNTFKAVLFKCLDNVLYISSHLISLAILIMGLYNGSSEVNTSTSSQSSSSTWFFIIGVLGAVNGLLVEISKRYNFEQRSSIIYDCATEYETMILTLRELKISPIPPDQKMAQIKDIELSIKNIQMKAFNCQIIKTPPPSEVIVYPTPPS